MEDKDIFKRILQHHDANSYKEIVRKYSGMVFSKAYSIVCNKDLAAEITQHTFVKAYTNISDWNGNQSIGPWLSVIAVHLALDTKEKMKKRKLIPIDTEIADDDISDEHEQNLQRMETAIQSLPDQDRTIIRLHYYKQQKTSEIAKYLNLSPSNVLVRLHRIREKLRQQLTHEDDE